MKKIFLLFTLQFLINSFCSAQKSSQQKADSLLSVFKTTREDTSKINILSKISTIYSSTSVDSEIYYAQKAYDLGLTLSGYDEKFKTSLLLCKSFAHKGLSDKALEMAFQCLKLAETSENKFYIIKANKNISQVYSGLLNNSPKALEYGLKALNLAKETGNLNELVDNLQSVSGLYIDAEKYNEALTYSNEAYNKAVLLKDTAVIVQSLVNLGDQHRTMKQYNMSILNFKKAIGILKTFNPHDINNQNDLAMLYYSMAMTYSENDDNKTAIDYLLLCINVAEKNKWGNNTGSFYQGISQAYMKVHDLKNALKYNNLAIKCEEAKGTSEQLKQLYLQNVIIYEKMKNYKMAYLSLCKYVSKTDDALNYETRNKISQLEVNLESEKKQKEIDIINKDKEQQKIIRNAFIVGSLLLVLLILVLINRNKLKRAVEMERMRSRLSRDLHDDIGSTLSSINILSRTAQSNLKQSSDEKTKASLEKINERSQRLLDNMSDIIWNINPGNDTIEDVMSRMREYATTMLEAKNIDYTFNFPKEKMDCKLSMEVKNNLYLIFKEAVNNLSKYSGCTHANLSLTFDEKNIHLIIEDNGKGFNEEEIKHRGGLRNMQHRAEEIKGAIKINSEIEKGTSIELTMPRYC